MSKENLANLLKAAGEDRLLMQEMMKTSTCEELKAFASERGYKIGNLDDAQIKRMLSLATGAKEEKELTIEELETVAGGFLLEVNGYKEAFRAHKESNKFTATDDLWK